MVDRDDVFEFEGFRLDRRGGGLFQRDAAGLFAPVQIGQRALDVLGALVERAGDIVTRDDLLAAVWPQTVVEDNNLNMQIAALRRVLDDGRMEASCIQTIPRRGYRFTAPVVRASRPAQPPADPASEPGAPVRAAPRHAALAGLVGALLFAAAAATAAWTVPRWFAAGPEVPRLSIVVLPFANLAGDPGQQYFVDGSPTCS
jgi:DNA-binding winged helix-turn-helix (wHTH) protein